MPVSPCSCSHSLVFWTWPQPMNGRGGRRADRGEGWLAFSTSNGPRGGCACISSCLDCAWEPHSHKPLGDRQRVGEGKRVSVSEGFGGRRRLNQTIARHDAS